MRIRIPNKQQKWVNKNVRFFEGDLPEIDKEDILKYRDQINNVLSDIERNMINLEGVREKELKSFLNTARLFNSSLKVAKTFSKINR